MSGSNQDKRMRYALELLKLYAEADGEVARIVVVDIVDEALTPVSEEGPHVCWQFDFDGKCFECRKEWGCV